MISIKGASFQRNCGAASVGVLQDTLVLSTGLIMLIGQRKEIRKLTLQVLALRQSESAPTKDSPQQRANAGNISFRISLWWPIHIINPVDKTKLIIL